MKQGKIELRSGVWEWRLLEPGEKGGNGSPSLRLSAEGRPDEMVARVPARGLAELDVRQLAERACLRRFTTEDGTVWTAELKSPRVGLPGGYSDASMVLFWSDQRACLTTLRPRRGLGEMTVSELRDQLRLCLQT